ncbi:hypothetical protein R4Q14_04510 [Brachyspira intermedia]|uniref:hypothetical protein n=1 Tax=Brachyspira intermedia TaxID=84377 RepID=UPI0030053878
MLTFGSLSEEGRSNGIQQDAMQVMTGYLGYIYCNQIAENVDGILSYWKKDDIIGMTVESKASSSGLAIDNRKQVRTSTENRTKNRKIRIYKRIA